MREQILASLNWRYAVQVFDKQKKINAEDLHVVLESGRLATSSMGIEPWKFIVVENSNIRAKLQEAGYGQPKISEASHLIVIARRTDVRENIANERIERTAKTQQRDPSELGGLKDMIEGTIAGMSNEVLDRWVSEQGYIALGAMIETASLLKIDSAPIGGFSPEKFDEILGLKSRNLASSVILALGYRGDDKNAERPKVRRKFEDVVEFIN